MHLKKRKLSWILPLFLLTQHLPALDYFENDFRDKNNTTHINTILEIKSNSLPIDVFEKDWDTMPSHKTDNYAFGQLYFDIYHNFYDFKIGIFKEEKLYFNINDGFIQTWYHAKKDFNTLLHKAEIGNDISYVNIDADINYYDTQGLFIQEIIPLSKNHTFSVKVKLLKAKDLQSLEVYGKNDSQKFQMSFDYYYSDKNHISKNKNHDDIYQGSGYGFDLEYIYDNDKIYFYSGILNLNSYINWESITFMHYDFDSGIYPNKCTTLGVTYIKDNGYLGCKSFGTGYYKYNINFKQKLPILYKVTLDYKIKDFLSIGNNLDMSENIYFNETYINMRILNSAYKLGYIHENENILLGAYFENIDLSISKDLSTSSKIIQAKLHISF